jgi:hypothetical protein
VDVGCGGKGGHGGQVEEGERRSADESSLHSGSFPLRCVVVTLACDASCGPLGA